MKRAAALSSRLSLGRLAYLLFFLPMGLIRQSIREGGPIAQVRDRAGHRAMRAAAARLPALAEPPLGPPAEIAFLSGPKFWHQTLLCFVSLQGQIPFRISPVIYDDGGLDVETRTTISRVIPWVRFVNADQSERLLDDQLPEGRFPALRKRRREYLHLRKLTDIHAGSAGFRLVADSDMLFFHFPSEIERWFHSPGWLYMQDVATAYGYPVAFLNKLAGAKVPERVNVGLYAVDGAAIDWDAVEIWCRRQETEFGPHYLQEQALTAMLFAGRRSQALAADRYVVMPDRDEATDCSAVLHHYVDLSKREYYRRNWRRFTDQAIRP